MEELIKNGEKMGKVTKSVYPVNSHLHTPYSFSAFSSIEQMFQLAEKENIKVLGINDFFTADGYNEFNSYALKYKIYPLFNIEFIGLSKEFQQQGLRVNDPNNPGRIYLSGKGLKQPMTLSPALFGKLKSVQEESQQQVKEMINKANDFFSLIGVDIKLNYNKIKSLYAKNLVRERHIAKAIYEMIMKKSAGSEDAALNLFSLIYSGVKPSSLLSDRVAFENEIRSKLLKSGGQAFVPEDETAFLSITQIIEIIKVAGGLPCYPVLLDDAKGNFTEFEKDWDKMYHDLVKLNIGCIELIPNRNSIEILENFVNFFRSKNFPVFFGTEHNSPEMIPLIPMCRNNVPLSDNLKYISYEGACVIAGHQHLVKENKEGFAGLSGSGNDSEIEKIAALGNSLIEKYIS